MNPTDRKEFTDLLQKRLDLAVQQLISSESEATRGKIKELQYLIKEITPKPL